MACQDRGGAGFAGAAATARAMASRPANGGRVCGRRLGAVGRAAGSETCASERASAVNGGCGCGGSAAGSARRRSATADVGRCEHTAGAACVPAKRRCGLPHEEPWAWHVWRRWAQLCIGAASAATWHKAAQDSYGCGRRQCIPFAMFFFVQVGSDKCHGRCLHRIANYVSVYIGGSITSTANVSHSSQLHRLVKLGRPA
mmetsp:Transcript_39751/g.118311  ORF Transcript_39751/g.118311 Transcript_39751/m.118311 type:complete len:200 (-) Transcript_39751:65-664(-)